MRKLLLSTTFCAEFVYLNMNKVVPYSSLSPRSPRSRYEDRTLSARSIDSNCSVDHSLEDAGSTPRQRVKKSNSIGIDLSKLFLKKPSGATQQSPRRAERGSRSNSSTARNLRRSSRNDDDDNSVHSARSTHSTHSTHSTCSTSVSRSNSQNIRRKPKPKKRVSFRVPLEDHYCYDVSYESYSAGDFSVNEDEFASAQQASKREICRVRIERWKKRKKGFLSSFAQCCIS